jgi:hypothetical protein
MQSTENRVSPDGYDFIVVGAGAAGWVDGNPSIYQELARRHAAGTQEIGPEQVG